MPDVMTEVKPQPKFFPGSKRKLSLEDIGFKMNNESEKRIRLDFAMPLTGETFTGMPAFIGAPFESMNKEDSVESKSTLTAELEGITAEFFATDKSPRRHQMLTATTLRSFYLDRDEEGVVTLHFSVTVTRDEELVVWAHKYQGATMWAAFEATQPSLKAPVADDKQMNLGEQASGKPAPIEGNCNFGDEHIGFCVLPKGHKDKAHDCQKGTREQSRAADAAKAVKPKSRAEKEAAAVAANKPRGFTGRTNPSAN